MSFLKFQVLAAVALFLPALFFQGCASLDGKKQDDHASQGPNDQAPPARTDSSRKPFSALRGKKKATFRETSDVLVAIANSPSAMLPPDTTGKPSDPTPTPPEAPAQKKKDPESTIFKKDSEISLARSKTIGLDPNRIHIGDIFSGQQGMALRKAVSFSDSLFQAAPDAEAALLKKVSSVRFAKIPLTLSPAELAELKRKAGPDTALPTRSVALDFDSTIHTARTSELESLLRKLTSGRTPELEGQEETETLLKSRMEQTRNRILEGETLYVITKVTRSKQAVASFPGAPLGERDVKAIRNATDIMFPQFHKLKAERDGDRVILSQAGGMTWTFEASPLKLKNGRLKIDTVQSHTFQ